MTGKGISLRRDWICRWCEATLTTYVTMPVAPTHRCHNRGDRIEHLTDINEKENNRE